MWSHWVSFPCLLGGDGDGREGDRPVSGSMSVEVKDLQRRMILAPTPRERWYATSLLAQGWTSSATAQALERDPHTIGRGRRPFRGGRARRIDLRADRGFPRSWRDATGGVEDSGPRIARQVGHRPGQLDPSACSGGSWCGSFSWNDAVSVCAAAVA